MSRHVFAPAASLLFVAFTATAVLAQATKAAPTTGPAPATPAKWAKLHRGAATIEVIQAPARKVGNEIVTVVRIRNTSAGSLALLKAEETWFDKNLKAASGDAPKPLRQPIAPGEIVEITFRAPYKPDLYRSSYQFTHANGEVKATPVKAFK